MKKTGLILIVCIIWAGCTTKEKVQTKTKIAFGSCAHQDSEEQLWDDINAENADLFIFLGDLIYGDTHNMSILKAKYEKQKNRPGYQKLMKSTPIIGVWDDHDYGVNDGGKYYAKKDSSKLLLLDFLDVPETHEINRHKGAYGLYTYMLDGHKINFYLLDTRYFRDTLEVDTTGKSRYLTNYDGDVLGAQQWQWLEGNLKQSTADLNVIASSIQLIAKEHPYEKWANFPKARKKLLTLIDEANAKNTIVISGDRHIAELSKLELNSGKELYDFTSSGLTHTWSEIWEESNKFRQGNLIIAKNYGLLTIDWATEKIKFEVRGKNQKSLLQHTITIE